MAWGFGLSAGRTRLMNRLEARRAGFTHAATGFVSQPEPRTMGIAARGRQLIAGNVQLGGFLVEAGRVPLWQVRAPDAAFTNAAQGFGWLDDLAAVGDLAARARAQDWTYRWIGLYGRGTGPGWTPDLTGRRVIRWVNHALLMLAARPPEDAERFYRALARQVLFLSRRWSAAAPGLPRFEALTGLVYAGLALTGLDGHVDSAVAALSRECAREIDGGGGLPTRNPEALLEVFTLLTWAAQALAENDRTLPPALIAAMERIAPTLRSLRHADGGLARFHGGGRGMEGRLDHALAQAGIRKAAQPGLAMGFARLSGGRTSVIVDAAPPPGGAASVTAHASTLAFELTSGRRPLVVNCGPGAPFGTEWRRASRATASHSVLEVEGYSSSRMGANGDERLIDCARILTQRRTSGGDGTTLSLSHTGWSMTHGLTHSRWLTLSPNGRKLTGIDALAAMTAAERRRFEALMTRTRLEGVAYAIRFHLHPDVTATLDLGGTAVSMAQRSGEVWVLRFGGAAELRLEPSVHLEAGRLKPRATTAIVLAARLRQFEGVIRWTIAKAQDTPLAIRDLDPDDSGSLF